MQINPVQFDYANSALIKPPFAELQNKEVKHKVTRVVFDSRDRNTQIFPTPSQYEIELPDDIEEVTSVELVVADVPLKAYNISNNNNKLKINERIVEIPPGEYNGTSLAYGIQQLLNDIFNEIQTFTINYNSTQDKIIISSDSGFTIKPVANSINKVLGLDNATTYNSDNRNNLTPPFRVNLSDNRYIIMNMDQVSLNNSSNTILHKSFAVLNNSMGSLNYINATSKIIKYLNPPIARLYKVRLTFRDYYGNLYDFQNHENRIEVIFESRKHLSRFM
jgi:hypothetical protein